MSNNERRSGLGGNAGGSGVVGLVATLSACSPLATAGDALDGFI